jgi:DNA-binding transcriptional MerR regulator/transcriptional regulator with XRE-family HTH domain
MSGVSEATLRMWEKRYHWPLPERRPSGYRFYSREQIAEIKRLGDLIANGARIGEIILDGEPHWPTAQVPRPERPTFDFSTIPRPESTEAQHVRLRLEEAIASQDQGTIAWALAQAAMLRPRDRARAVHDLLALAGIAPSPSSAPQDPRMNTDPTSPTDSQPQTTGTEAAVAAAVTPIISMPAEDEEAPVAAKTAAGAGFDLPGALRSRMTTDSLSITAAAKAIGVNPAAVGNILSKGSRPNARTAARFAAWLGLDPAQRASGKGADGARRGKPGRKPAAAKADKPPKAEKKEHAEKPAKPGRRGPKRKTAGMSTDEVLAIVRAAIEGARAEAKTTGKTAEHPILKDPLALMVHEASAELRSALKAMLNLARKSR